MVFLKPSLSMIGSAPKHPEIFPIHGKLDDVSDSFSG